MRKIPGSSLALLALAAFLFPGAASAQVIGRNVIATPVTRQRIEMLPKPQQKAWLHYLDASAKQKAIDKQTLKSEQRANGVTAPKAAPMGRGMYVLQLPHPAAWYGGSDAIRIAHNMVTYQVPDGGWSKNIDMTAGPRAPGNRYDSDNLDRFASPGDFDQPADPHWHYIATLDNDATWMQIEFLARVATALQANHRNAEAAPFRASVERGIEYLLRSQYPNGGWPQVWPLEGGYHDAITLNDDAMLHAVEILHQVATGAPDFQFVPLKLARRARPAAQRGIACLLRLQIREHGIRTAWAQQYDALTLEPTSARNYEMAALSSDESASIVAFLMDLPEPTSAEVAAVRDAAAWFKKVAIYGERFGSGNLRADRRSPAGRKLIAVPGAGPIWSRYYQIGTDRPIFGDRDKTIHADVNDLSRERRNGYAWFNKKGTGLLAEYATWAKSHPA